MRTGKILAGKIIAVALAALLFLGIMPVYAVETVSFGSQQTKLKTGTEYVVPLALKNAGNLQKDSAAASCMEPYGTLSIDQNGKAKLRVKINSVTMMGMTGYASNFQIYQQRNVKSEKIAAVVTKGSNDQPEEIEFTIPDGVKNLDGVYLNMTVAVMQGMNPDAFLQIDYKNAKEPGSSSMNDTVKKSAHITQFGEYDIETKVTVKEGKISDIQVEGSNFGGNFKDSNQNIYLPKAMKHIQSKMIGISKNDAKTLNGVDVTSGATTTARAIKESVIEALGVEVKREEIPQAPESVQPGVYTIQMKNTTDVVDHSLAGGKGDKKVTAILFVDNYKKMTLSYAMISNTKEEPLAVLGFNGYYNGTKLSTNQMKVVKEQNGNDVVVSEVAIPLTGDKPMQKYKTNVRLYVPSMKNLNGDVSGVKFENGKFNVDSTITLYWDTLQQTQKASNAYLSDGIYKITGKMLKPDGSTSMANEAITHKLKLTVKNGTYELTMNLKGLNLYGQRGYLSKIQYFNSGYGKDRYGNPTGNVSNAVVESVQKYTDGTVVKDNFGTNYPDLITFPLISEAIENGVIPMQVYVPVMESIQAGNGTQKVYLTLDWTSVVKTIANDKDFSSEDVIEDVPGKLSAPASVKASSVAYNKIKISWKKVSKATRYEVYQNNKKVADTKETSYTKGSLVTGTKYSYKVRAYKVVSGKKIYSGYSKTVTAAPALSAVSGIKAVNSTKSTVKLTWKRVGGANGYVVYRSAKNKNGYKAIKTFTNGTQVSYIDKKLKKNSTYFYKIRAYKNIGKKKIYAPYSKVISIKIKK